MATLATILYALTLALLSALHFVRRDVSPVSGAVSDFGLGCSAGLFGLYLGVGSAAALALAVLMLTAPDPAPSVAAGVCLALMALARLGVALCPTDGPDAAPTRRGRAHLVFATTTFLLGCAVVVIATPALSAAPDPSALRPLWPAMRLAIVIALVATAITMRPRFRPVFGLPERAFIFGTELWFLLASVWFLVR